MLDRLFFFLDATGWRNTDVFNFTNDTAEAASAAQDHRKKNANGIRLESGSEQINNIADAASRKQQKKIFYGIGEDLVDLMLPLEWQTRRYVSDASLKDLFRNVFLHLTKRIITESVNRTGKAEFSLFKPKNKLETKSKVNPVRIDC